MGVAPSFTHRSAAVAYRKMIGNAGGCAMLGCTWLVDIFTTSVYVLIADKKAKFPKRIAGLPNALYTPPNS